MPGYLRLNGAEILFNPSATVSGKSQYLWELEQPAQAVANGVFIGANNRVGVLKSHGKSASFTVQVTLLIPGGNCWLKESDDKDELVTADLDLEQIREVRDGWQFFRDRRPETYYDICDFLP